MLKDKGSGLALVGGGHAHLFVLEAMAQGRLRIPHTVLISPSRWQYYSGMLPGLMAGHYRVEQCRIDLEQLATRAGVRFIEQAVVSLDAEVQSLCLSGGGHLKYALASLDVGSETELGDLVGFQGRLIGVKPLDKFHADWLSFKDTLQRRGYGQLVVAGAGAAGVELAMAAAYALAAPGHGARVTLVASEHGVLPGFASGVRKAVMRELTGLGVEIYTGGAAAQGNLIQVGRSTELHCDALIAATGAKAPYWLRSSALRLDSEGFIEVDANHRSLSHPNLFAVGDIASRPGSPLMRSGVHSVRAGPVLAHNLGVLMNGGRLQPFHPRAWVLYLISCGARRAVASWGPFAFAGDWVWRWKDRIDRGFIARFSSGGENSALL
ncbi:pyridine nucleotide-disulfide oxidoreductase [Marinobacterium zhoushanense]|uniref:Pyridine nucleotide-disulfide oxidoreductase n=1 Tax=Marinobacterium zhoushanense TaxID=1679163 RepID=A0ABQ1KPR9_9GAMM|nr:FAD-dependent oxidoreductase [Marinobacterium zhoushanense]GGC01444.1 pyridine nucleotide-disulfide oxidoreductase [Marinobacterium zhoushanense]